MNNDSKIYPDDTMKKGYSMDILYDAESALVAALFLLVVERPIEDDIHFLMLSIEPNGSHILPFSLGNPRWRRLFRVQPKLCAFRGIRFESPLPLLQLPFIHLEYCRIIENDEFLAALR